MYQAYYEYTFERGLRPFGEPIRGPTAEAVKHLVQAWVGQTVTQDVFTWVPTRRGETLDIALFVIVVRKEPEDARPDVTETSTPPE